MARNVVQVSFKNSDRELEMYDIVSKSYSASAFIKECIAFYLEHKGSDIKNTSNDSNDIEDVDWEF